jgi:hypothetical protein
MLQVLIRGGTAAPFRKGRRVPLAAFDLTAEHPPLPAPAFSRWFGADGSWSWRRCTALDFDPACGRFLIQWDRAQPQPDDAPFRVSQLEVKRPAETAIAPSVSGGTVNRHAESSWAFHSFLISVPSILQAGLTPDKPRPPITEEDLRAVLRINLRFDVEDVQLHANETAFHLQQREQVLLHRYCPYRTVVTVLAKGGKMSSLLHRCCDIESAPVRISTSSLSKSL